MAASSLPQRELGGGFWPLPNTNLPLAYKRSRSFHWGAVRPSFGILCQREVHLKGMPIHRKYLYNPRRFETEANSQPHGTQQSCYTTMQLQASRRQVQAPTSASSPALTRFFRCSSVLPQPFNFLRQKSCRLIYKYVKPYADVEAASLPR